MFKRFSNSWALVKASASVLKSDKKLMVFPLVSLVVTLIVTASFVIPLSFTSFFDLNRGGVSAALYVVALIIFYLVQYFVIFFANTALVGAAMIRLKGGTPTLGDGFRIAASHSRAILGYAAIAATVGLVLRLIQERGGLAGKIGSAVLGIAWNVTTYLVVPVLIVEGVGPIAAIKRSASLLKKTWGEQIIGNFSIGLVFGVIFLAVFIVGAVLIAFASASGSVVAMALVISVVVLVMLFISLISATLSGIYVAAVYQYAATGETNSLFPQDVIKGAFRSK
jgi:hypothetical protein